MAKDETRRWRGWRTSQPTAEIKGSQPTKKPGTRKKPKDKLRPWFWIKNTKPNTKCEGCGGLQLVGQTVAFSRPKKILCTACVDEKGLRVKTSVKLAKERAGAKRLQEEIDKRKAAK